MTAKAIIIGAPRSGSGKTSVTIGLLRALRRRGLKVRGAKSGPDYIDPGFHAAATGAPGVNLDSWAMSPDLLGRLLADQAADADIVVIESAMGLFDGIPSETGRTGSAAEIARRFGIPVLLVLDVSGQSQTAAAVAKGFATYDPDVRIGGVIMNKLGSERHRRLSGDAIAAIGLPVVGAVMRDSALTLPERHLGLVQAEEHAGIDSHIDHLADAMERSLDIDGILSLATDVETLPAFALNLPPSVLSDISPSRGEIGRPHVFRQSSTLPISPLEGKMSDRTEGGRIKVSTTSTSLPPPGQRIAMARDAAFSFLYPHLAADWRAAGAEIVPFSPLADEAPDASCDVCWLPGGYPELHAGLLSSASRFRQGTLDFAASKPVHGECGGFMVLGQSIQDAEGVTHSMLGLLGHATSFAKRKMNLGYRRATLLSDCPLGPAGSVVRGHEFHYAQVLDAGQDTPLAELADGQGNTLPPSGARRGHVSGTFFHAIAMEPA